MAILTDTAHAGNFIASEASGTRSRETVTIGAGKLAAGTVLGKLTSGGNYIILTPGASDGSQTAAGVLFDAVDATGAATKGVIVARDAEVNGASLVYPAAISAPNKAAAIVSLTALGIIVR